MKLISLAVLLAAFCLPTAGFAATNLVANGSFEQTTAFSGWTTYFGFNAIPGWNAGANGIEIQQSGVSVGAQDGNNVLELDTYANSYIWQEIDTTPGQTYELSFYFSPRPGVSFDSNKLVYKFGDLFNWTSQDGSNNSAADWVKVTGTTIAQASTTRLGFLAWGTSDSYGGLIDNVSVNAVTPVPEPETYALLGMGLAGVALMRRRKLG